ncbi:uncharacterized protein LOC144702979 [Wolffia australiana]
MDEKKRRGGRDSFLHNKLEKQTIAPAFNFMMQFSDRIQGYFKAKFQQPVKTPETKNLSSAVIIEKETGSPWALNFEKQLQAWRNNPAWITQKYEVEATVPKGSLCNLNVKFTVGLPPDAIYNIVTDPENKRVFKNIKEVISRKVLLDEGSRQVVEVEQAALWKFLWWSGVISVHVFVDQNRKNHTVRFKQGNMGFMKRFEGCWKVEPLFVDEDLCSPEQPRTLSEYEACSASRGRVGSLVTLEQLIQPTIVPPPPISWYLRGITTRTTEMLIDDLIAEAERLKSPSNGPDLSQIVTIDLDLGDQIKQRWRQRRQPKRRLLD